MAETKSPGTKPAPSKLTAKEITFLKGLASGKTKVQAAQDAYPTATYQTAASIATDNLKKPKIRDALAAAYDKVGLTPQSIADVLSDAMLAKKTIQAGGQLIETQHADHGIRVSAARTAAQLIGAGDKGDPADKPNVTFNVGTKNYINTNQE